MGNIRTVTLTPGYWIYICPCGFEYRVSRVTSTCSKNATYCFKCKQQNGKFYRVMDENLNFDENYNGKLNCVCFTTFRLHDQVQNAVGAKKQVYLKGVFKGEAKIMSVSTMRLDQINVWASKLDAGMLPGAFCKLIKELYKDRRNINWDYQLMDFLLLEYCRDGREPGFFN